MSSDTISGDSFSFLAGFLKQRSGIVLGPDKQYLVQLRLGPLARQAGCLNIETYLAMIRRGGAREHETAVVEAMTTNETSFFRDSAPFEALRHTLIPQWLKGAKAEPLRIWCAASSTGQEPYSIAMIVREYFPQLARGRVEILATDLANSVLTLARAGRYSQLEVGRGMPPELLTKYFKCEGNTWLISPEIRSMVEYRQFNLCTTWPVMKTYDIVFLRNVLIYFTVEAKREIFAKVRRVLGPGGVMFLGSSETTVGVDDTFVKKPCGTTICYVPRTEEARPRTAQLASVS